MTFIVRSVVAAGAIALAALIAAGAIAVPNVAALVQDATTPLGAWIYLGVAVFVFLETTVLLGFLIHGELLLMLGGAAAARGAASLALEIALVWAAAVAGDMASLLLGRRLGRPVLERRVPLARVDGFFARHGAKAFFLGRFSGFLRSTMPFVVGSAGVTPRRMLPFSVASGLVWTATFTVIGYTLADSFARTGALVTRIGTATILAVVAALALWSVLRRRPRASTEPADPARGGRPAG